MTTNKLALVTGVTGQDGSYLAELLLLKNYTVIGLKRRSSTNNNYRIEHILDDPNFTLEEFDLTDPTNVIKTIDKYQPEEFYNLAAQSHVKTSFSQPTTTICINTLGVINILEAIKTYSSTTKFYQASTSEMFGMNYDVDDSGDKYQDENTNMLPQSPYGIAKLASHRMLQIYRESYGLFACSGILFNHESPRRGENFVTRKITKYIGDLMSSKTSETLKLGNLSAKRDWGHAKDYVEAMYLMLQQSSPDDYVICTEETWSVLDFVKKAFDHVGLDYRSYVEIDQSLYRPCEVDYLKGKNSKARKQLSWEPNTSFDELIGDMIDSDIKAAAINV
jgi:GDPmannose 4,6-dehydratase|tara:strand:+ start:6397 stop:7398 length:1002 start_codon:yes stop_codon:yes gene_type:complete